MEGVNNVAGHAMMVAGMRSVDMSAQAANATTVHKEFTLSRSTMGSTVWHDVDKKWVVHPRTRGESPNAAKARKVFRKTLLVRYPCVLAAWRELDPNKHGRIAFFDFCRACRNLGCDNEAKSLWNALDADGDGFITLFDIDGRLSELLHEFADAMKASCGSAEAAWKQFFCTNGMGRCPVELFTKSCGKAGFEGDIPAVYDALNVDRTPTGVSFQDFVLLDKWFKASPPGKWGLHNLRATLPCNCPPGA